MRRRDLARQLPVEAALVSDFGAAWPELALGAGEDFELVATLPREALPGLLASWPNVLAPLTVAGRLREGTGIDRAGTRRWSAGAGSANGSRHFG